ncbi:MAG: sodium:solute symporter family protein [Acidobacteria bacterium]|nr:sodium:solute symporter family protein [Acidobacteriota bacterium]
MAVLAVLGLYAVFLALGLRAARRARGGSVSELLVAGRAMPIWLATLTMTATWVDGGYLLGTVEGTFKSSVALGVQGGLCFGISLVLGGVFFARRMRALEFTTLIDPFESRFGPRWAAVLMLPALAAELFWSAELLVALGSTLGVMAGIGLAAAILLSAAVVTAYTMAGGIWSVAYTDALQLGLVALGLLVAIPVVFDAVGGLATAWAGYAAARPGGAGLLPPFTPTSAWTLPAITAWWDVSAMLMLGGIPWNCYFQRVLSCRTPSAARWHSVLSGLLTIAFTVPPLLLGVAAAQHAWPPEVSAALEARPAETLPAVFRYLTPAWIAVLGLGAIIGAVTSSFSASILSAGSMFAWNCCSRFLRPAPSAAGMRRLVRVAVLLLGAGAAVLALEVQSVQALWFFTSDLVFVLLFPQLVAALFDRRVNRIGSITAFSISLALRLGGGEPLFGIAPLIPYPELLAPLLPGGPSAWYDAATGAILLPYKTVAAAAGVATLPIVSRLTARWDPPRPLGRVQQDADATS